MQLLGGQILLATSNGRAGIQPGVIEIDGEHIVSVQLGEISSHIDFGGPNALICPGLIDTHLHLPQFDSIGAAGMRLLPWLNEVIYPAEQRWNDLTFAQSMIRRVAARCLSVGTTSVCAYATSSHPATLAALKTFGELGFRGVIGQVMMNRNASQELLRPVDQFVDEVDLLLQRFPSKQPMAAAVTPRFALSCTNDLLVRAGQLAKAHDAVIQTHLAETQAECNAVGDLFDRRQYVDVYDDAGLLTPKSILAHGIHLKSDCRRRLAQRGSAIAHCPTANSFLDSGMMDRATHLTYGIPLTLGSDIGAGYEHSMVRVARAMIETAMRVTSENDRPIDDPLHVPAAVDAWHQITAGNADALGWDDVGRIDVGKRADLLVVEPAIAWLETRCPLSTLLFAWDDRWITSTILRGRVGYRWSKGAGSLGIGQS